jgi:hypothetical protein
MTQHIRSGRRYLERGQLDITDLFTGHDGEASA